MKLHHRIGNKLLKLVPGKFASDHPKVDEFGSFVEDDSMIETKDPDITLAPRQDIFTASQIDRAKNPHRAERHPLTPDNLHNGEAPELCIWTRQADLYEAKLLKLTEDLIEVKAVAVQPVVQADEEARLRTDTLIRRMESLVDDYRCVIADAREKAIT